METGGNISVMLAAFVVAVAAGGATAQTADTNQPVRAQVVQVPAQNPNNPPPAAVVVTEPGTRDVDIAPADPASADVRRVFVDTGVSDVRLDSRQTIATMNQSPISPCASNQYVYERDRPKWQYQTGRLMIAMKEGATVRISFSCVDGLQSINAVQFLSPPGAQVAQAMPVRDTAVNPYLGRQQTAPRLQAPAGTDLTGQTLQERTRNIPLP